MVGPPFFLSCRILQLGERILRMLNLLFLLIAITLKFAEMPRSARRPAADAGRRSFQWGPFS